MLLLVVISANACCDQYSISCVVIIPDRLWEDGWKDRYYETKFDVSCDDTEFVRQVVESYMEGLCWVMAYYYQVQ